MRSLGRNRGGFTMTELLVVLAILGLMSGIVSLAWRAPRTDTARDPHGIAAARRQALETGRPVRTTLTVDGHVLTIAALPDGRVIAPAGLHVDQLTGALTRE